MDRRFLTLVGASLMFAVVVSGVFYFITMRAGRPVRAQEPPSVGLVVAAKALPVGLQIEAGDVRLEKVPVGRAPKGSFQKIEEVVGRSVTSPILSEEPVIEGRLAEKGSGAGLQAVIPAGMRAVTVRVNDVVGVAGFVLPGMRVDVLITGEPPGQTRTQVTRTVLQNIRVLSAGTTMQTDPSGKPVNTNNVTLLVSPGDAESLTLAGNEGKIHLVLRNASDEKVAPTPGVSLSALYGAQAEPPKPVVVRRAAAPTVVPAAAAPAPAPAPAVVQVVTIRGEVSKVESVPADVVPGAAQEEKK